MVVSVHIIHFAYVDFITQLVAEAVLYATVSSPNQGIGQCGGTLRNREWAL